MSETLNWLNSPEGRAVVEWGRFPESDKGCQNKFANKRCGCLARETRLGRLCLDCWLDFPRCTDCGKTIIKEPGERRKQYKNGKPVPAICRDCLDIKDKEYRDQKRIDLASYKSYMGALDTFDEPLHKKDICKFNAAVNKSYKKLARKIHFEAPGKLY